jgi:anti-sigma B factor antagonist
MADVTTRQSEQQVVEVEVDMSAPPFAVETMESTPDTRHLVVRGELDISTAPKLNTQLSAAFRAEVDRVVLDLRDVSFIDSTGLGVLVSARQRAKGSNVLLKLRLPDGSARFAFQVTGLADSFDT